MIEKQWNEAVAQLEKEKTSHAGTAPAQVKRKAIKAIEKLLKEELDLLCEVTTFFAEHKSPSAKEVAAHLIPHLYDQDESLCIRLMYDIADDENWEVREWAAGGCGEILALHFEDFYPVLSEWKVDDSENIRRAVVLAVMYASKTLDESYAHKLLHLLEPLMSDGSTYVKKNLGAFAIGDALLKRYPQAVVPWLFRIVDAEDENVRWNVANVFTSASSRTFYEEGEELLKKLEDDESKLIQRAVKKARRNLEKATSAAPK